MEVTSPRVIEKGSNGDSNCAHEDASDGLHLNLQVLCMAL